MLSGHVVQLPIKSVTIAHDEILYATIGHVIIRLAVVNGIFEGCDDT